MCASKLNCMEWRSKAVGEAEAGYQQACDTIKVADLVAERSPLVRLWGFDLSWRLLVLSRVQPAHTKDSLVGGLAREVMVRSL